MTPHRHSRLSLLSSLVVVLVAAAALATPAAAAERVFSLKFKHAFIDKLIERVAKETRRTILFDEQIRGTISVVTKRPVSEDEAWGILEGSLSILGYSLLPSTVGHWRIAKLSDAIREAPFRLQAGRQHDSFVTTLIPLANASLGNVIEVLEPIAGSGVKLVPYRPTNSLIASGSERSIARLTEIADELDRLEEQILRFRVLRYRDVTEIGELVEARAASLGDGPRRLQIWSDERTNSILFRGTDEAVASLADFLDRIDHAVVGGGEVQVLRVLNRDPEQMATLISALSEPRSSARTVAEIRVDRSSLLGADFTIAVDKATRSLVVRAAPSIQLAIREILEELDVPPQLISVDLTISEIRRPRSRALGFAFSVPIIGDADSDAKDLVGRLVSEPVAGATLARLPGSETAIYGRIARDTGVSFSGPNDLNGIPIMIPIEDTGVIQGADFSIRTEVLIQPHLVIVSGERHEIFVGMNVPVPVSEGGLGEGDANSLLGISLTRTIRFERKDVGIRLVIDAKAGREGKIQLDLDVALSSLVPSLAGSIETVGPSFLEEALTARARLDHGETAIIGVNRQGKELRGRQGVPWFSRIPLLGWFFSADVESAQDVSLVIAVRARRLSSPAALAADSIRRRLVFQRQSARRLALPDSDGLPFAVRVTTRARKDDAEAIAESLSLTGHRAIVQVWHENGDEFFDIYVVSLASMVDAAEIASQLTSDGWDPDLVLLSTGPD
ncbi:MAG: secretin N-terminal domain-containing protein [Myxococcota bacterium]